MQLLSETLKYIVNTHALTPSISAIPLYLDHAPELTEYPIITINQVSNLPSMAMGNYDYSQFRIKFKVFTNEQGFSEGIDILEDIEDTFHRKSNVTLNNDVTLICSKVIGTTVTFFEREEKIWNISEDFQFMVGK